MAKSDYDDGGAAAGQSINKTLGDIEALLKGADFSPSSRPMRKKLRECLQQALEDVSESWYKKGFNRGHREAYQWGFHDHPDTHSTDIRTLIPR
ncbi:hypothetical protein [Pseudomonas sp. dw_358]|uniref:hypothetical protein n=1 Tax=Pseudomonas sp. dw_358 TaxID=2720083 RepID=UPI001BD429B0|nr:hypothetical protein [Pseudomonas sp. dw_358]